MSMDPLFELLHPDIQRWVWRQGWTSLRSVQREAMEHILAADRDLVISASTAAGKTEAAFLPACSQVLNHPPKGIAILYLSPLKALINDQYRRLLGLSEMTGLGLTPWHGDVAPALKRELTGNPNGIILITPESLESLLLGRAPWWRKAIGGLAYIIIDEFHAFIGTERGRQLQSLLHRLEFEIKRTVPRIALSATLGDLKAVTELLRPGREERTPVFPCEIVTASGQGQELKVQVRGYLEPAAGNPGGNEDRGLRAVAQDLYRLLRGGTHLVFANSRARTEFLAAKLRDLCTQDSVPNEFFPHHGSLAKELREELEARMQEDSRPSTALCTLTLELGIDIGKVDSVAQVTVPHSVAGMRQRVGRSGRRENAQVLRAFVIESETTAESHLADRLRLQTAQCSAMITLMAEKWVEPPESSRFHFSTLVQQTLALIAQYGGLRAAQLWSLLCQEGPFSNINSSLYAKLLRSLGEHELLTQTEDGLLVLGLRGERILDHYSFYAAFATPEEYTLLHDGQVLGSLPLDWPLAEGEHMVFAGKRWLVLSIDSERRQIRLAPARAGSPPLFSGAGGTVHDEVRTEMYRLYTKGVVPFFLDQAARNLLEEGIGCFKELGLADRDTVQTGNKLYLFPWLGDRVSRSIAALLSAGGLQAQCFGALIELDHCSPDRLATFLETLLAQAPPREEDLAALVADTVEEKYDRFVPVELRQLEYGARHFDVKAACRWLSGARLA